LIKLRGVYNGGRGGGHISIFPPETKKKTFKQTSNFLGDGVQKSPPPSPPLPTT